MRQVGSSSKPYNLCAAEPVYLPAQCPPPCSCPLMPDPSLPHPPLDSQHVEGSQQRFPEKIHKHIDERSAGQPLPTGPQLGILVITDQDGPGHEPELRCRCGAGHQDQVPRMSQYICILWGQRPLSPVFYNCPHYFKHCSVLSQLC